MQVFRVIFELFVDNNEYDPAKYVFEDRAGCLRAARAQTPAVDWTVRLSRPQ